MVPTSSSSPAVLVTRFAGSKRRSQQPRANAGNALAVGSMRTAQCRWVTSLTFSPGSRYFSTSFSARWDSFIPGGMLTGLDQRADEGREGGSGIAQGLTGVADQLGGGLGCLDDVEDDERDDQPGDDLLQVHRHLRGARIGPGRGVIRAAGPASTRVRRTTPSHG